MPLSFSGGSIRTVPGSLADSKPRLFPPRRPSGFIRIVVEWSIQPEYYFRSDVNVAPTGAHERFEGQARFSQLQYLYFASGSKLG